MFSLKQRDAFTKTTCGFRQNNVWFSLKRRVVFAKTTAHLKVKNTSEKKDCVTLVTAKNAKSL